MKRKRCRINVLLLDAAERRGEGRGGAKEEKEEEEGIEATRVSAENLKEMAGFEWARSREMLLRIPPPGVIAYGEKTP